MNEAPDTDELLELLGDEHVRTILRVTSAEPRSARELSEVCDVARSTVYRRVDEMVDHDLVAERTRIVTDGSHHNVYAPKVDRLAVDVGDGRLVATVEVRETAAGRFARMWEDIREA